MRDSSVIVPPWNLGKSENESVTQEIESLYIDKVIPELGLCTTLFEVCSIHGGVIYPGEGSAHYEVEFRVAVFRPFVGEILEGKVLNTTDANGVRLTFGFFHDVIVLPDEGINRETTKWNDSLDGGYWTIEDEKDDLEEVEEEEEEEEEKPRRNSKKNKKRTKSTKEEEKGNDGGEKQKRNQKIIEPGKRIRVRVREVVFPKEPKSNKELKERTFEEGKGDEDKFAPMVVKCELLERSMLFKFDDEQEEE